MNITEKIVYVLKKAAAIKDNKIDEEALCRKVLRYQGRRLGYLFCIKCYPDQAELDTPKDVTCEGCRENIREIKWQVPVKCHYYLDLSKMLCYKHAVQKGLPPKKGGHKII